MGRSELREHIFRILFRIEFQPKEEMEEQLALYLEELESAKDTEKEYIRTKYAAIDVYKRQEFGQSKKSLVYILMLAVIAAVFANFSGIFPNRQISEISFYLL